MSRDFDGSATRLTGGYGGSASPISFSAWFKTSNASQTGAIVCIGGSANNNNRQVMYAVGGKLAAQSQASGTSTATSGNSYSTTDWNHGFAYFTNSTSRGVILNGGTLATSGAARAPTGLNTSAIGAIVQASASTYFDGLIAEVGVWANALTAEDRAALASGVCPLLVRPELLIGYWPLFGRAGTGAEEDWFGDYPLSSTGSPPVDTDHPRIIYPKRQIWVPKAVSAPAAPTLSDLKAVSVTSSSVQGTYDYAF